MIEIKNLCQSYSGVMLFKDFSLDIPTHRITSIIGASGCGKSTFLKMLAGLLPYKSGSVKGISKNCISVVFQEDRLLPWLNVDENIRLVLSGTEGQVKKKSEDIGAVIEEILDMMDMKHSRYAAIDELSGGMQRRVAIARALAYDRVNKGDLLLLDEPFRGIDYKLRADITENLVSGWRKYGKTVLIVTHDNEEALRMSDCLIELYGRPVKAQIHVD